MTGRAELVAQATAFTVLLDELRAGKLTADTAKVLLGTASATLHKLLKVVELAGCGATRARITVEAEAAGDPFPYPDLAAAPDLAPADALPMVAMDGDACSLANPENLHSTCTAKDGHPERWHAMHGARGRVVEFWAVGVVASVAAVLASVIPPGAIPPEPPALPWLCAECGHRTGIRCWSMLSHGADVPVCASHSVPVPGADAGEGRECTGCANRREVGGAGDAGPVSGSVTGSVVVRVADDAPVPMTGRITGLGEFAGTVLVAWGEQRDADVPRTVVEPFDDLVPAPGERAGQQAAPRVLSGGAS